MKLERLRPVAVLWMDAARLEGWHERDDDTPQLASVVSCGFLVKKTADAVTLTMDLTDGDDIGSDISIPRSQIKRIIPLG